MKNKRKNQIHFSKIKIGKLYCANFYSIFLILEKHPPQRNASRWAVEVLVVGCELRLILNSTDGWFSLGVMQE